MEDKQRNMTNDELIQEEERVFANMQRQGWSTRWGNDSPKDEDRVTTEVARQTCCGCSDTVGGSGVKPLLVIQLRDLCTTTQIKILHERSLQIEAKTGYKCLIVDSMDDAKVQVFGVDAPGLETLTLDEVIDMLEALKRVREAALGA